MTDTDRKFRLGLTMAGAVSAGAYTAGVLDYFYAALDDQARNRTPEDLEIVLKALSGTSAGGVCAALSIPALAEGLRPFDPAAPSLPLLHRIWVTELDLLGGPQRPGLVSKSDLEKNRHVYSVLNSEALSAAAERTLADVRWRGRTHSFVADALEVFVTATDVTGDVYEVAFAGGGGGHRMANHANVAHFTVTGLGAVPGVDSPWLGGWKAAGQVLALDPAASPDAPQRLDFAAGKWSARKAAGIVTGAFPVGLAAQKVQPKVRWKAWPLDIDPKHGPKRVAADEDAAPGAFIGVDGGVINNEPFELARFTLRALAGDAARPWLLAPNPRAREKADRAVVMIDPFPEGPTPAAPDMLTDADRDIPAVLGKLKSALLDQARFKVGELVAAVDDDGRSRFLIAPSRDDGREGAEAIASGFLGGFGGFMDERFRQHDFELGRHNAQSFLRKHFRLAKVHDRYGPLPGELTDGPADEAPIVRLSDALLQPIREPDWPRMDMAEIERIVAAIEDRVAAVSGRIVRDRWSGQIGKWTTAGAWRAFGRAKLTGYLTRIILSELIQRDQIQEAQALSEAERKTLAALTAPGPDLRTVGGLARRSGLEEYAVRAALDGLSRPTDPKFELWEGPELPKGGRSYALKRYRPNLARRIPFLGDALGWLGGDVTTDVERT